MRKLGLAMILATLVLLPAACGSDDSDGSGSSTDGTGGSATAGGSGGGRICVAGQIQSCTGPGDCPGVEVCDEDGTGYGACECGSSGGTTGSGGAAGSPSGTGGSGETGGAAGSSVTGGTGGSVVDPACAAADGNGFFPDCSACLDPTDCDTIQVNGSSRQACGCLSAGCPCGFSCGSYDIGGGITIGGICVR